MFFTVFYFWFSKLYNEIPELVSVAFAFYSFTELICEILGIIAIIIEIKEIKEIMKEKYKKESEKK